MADRDQFVSAQSHDAAAVCSEPNSSVFVFVNIPDESGWQSVFCPYVLELSILELAYAANGSDPDRSIAGLGNKPDIVLYQAILRRVGNVLAAGSKAAQTLRIPDPEVSGSIKKQCVDFSVFECRFRNSNYPFVFQSV